ADLAAPLRARARHRRVNRHAGAARVAGACLLVVFDVAVVGLSRERAVAVANRELAITTDLVFEGDARGDVAGTARVEDAGGDEAVVRRRWAVGGHVASDALAAVVANRAAGLVARRARRRVRQSALLIDVADRDDASYPRIDAVDGRILTASASLP